MGGTATVTSGAKVWSVWLALTEAERNQGLGGLSSIPVNTGMLFDLGEDTPVTITTEPMLFNIDILFINSSLEIVDISDNIAPGFIVSEATPVRYVLEVNGGEAEEIDIGESIIISDYAPDTEVPSSDLGGIITSMTPIVLLGVSAAMMTGMMRGMRTKSTPKSSKYDASKLKMLHPSKAETGSSSGSFYRCRALFKDTGEIWESKVFTSKERASKYMNSTFTPEVRKHVKSNGLAGADVLVVRARRTY